MVAFNDAHLDTVFRALADGTRRDIVRRTAQGPLTVSTLAQDYAMSFAAVQKHVAVLEAAGLVTKEAQGRERWVRASPQEIARAREALQALEALWRHRLEGLDALLTESPQE